MVDTSKGPDAFRTISEVAEDLDLPQHVLRFWETRFSPIRPLKRGGGRRYYRPDDVDLLRGIRQLLYGQGYTIKGVQRILKEDGLRFVQGIGRGEPVGPPGRHGDESEGVHLRPALPPASNGAADRISSESRSDDESGYLAAPASPAAPDRASAAGGIDAGRFAPALLSHDLGRLRSALEELVECERVLATLRRD